MRHRCESRRDDIVGSEPPREPHDAAPASNPDIAEKRRGRSAAPGLASIIAITILCIMSVPQAAYPKDLSTDTDQVALELTALGKHGVVIARVREQVLAMLQTENACSAWFREAELDPAGVFRSLHYELEEDGSTYVLHSIDLEGTNLYKHPWTARSTQNGGRNSVIQLNPSGPFFSTSSPVMDMDPRGGHFSQGTTFHRLSVASFWGNTTRNYDTAARTRPHRRAPPGGRRFLGRPVVTKYRRSVETLQARDPRRRGNELASQRLSVVGLNSGHRRRA